MTLYRWVVSRPWACVQRTIGSLIKSSTRLCLTSNLDRQRPSKSAHSSLRASAHHHALASQALAKHNRADQHDARSTPHREPSGDGLQTRSSAHSCMSKHTRAHAKSHMTCTDLDELIDSRRWLQHWLCTMRSHATSTTSELALGRRQLTGLGTRSPCPQIALQHSSIDTVDVPC